MVFARSAELGVWLAAAQLRPRPRPFCCLSTPESTSSPIVPSLAVAVESVPVDWLQRPDSSHRCFSSLHHASRVPRDAYSSQVCVLRVFMSCVSPDGGFQPGGSPSRLLPTMPLIIDARSPIGGGYELPLEAHADRAVLTGTSLDACQPWAACLTLSHFPLV